ncbi:MAG TPA: hypothetical protein VF437_10675, partial [Verrucomicrobiae bacterium]
MQALAQQSSRGLEQPKTLRVFDGHHAARSVLDCGSLLPLSSADTRRKERNLLAKDVICRPDGAGEFLVWVSTKMSRLRRWDNEFFVTAGTAKFLADSFNIHFDWLTTRIE